MIAEKSQNRKAIALLSGGLDSILAAVMVKDLGVDVIGLHLSSPFGCRENVEEMAKKADIPLVIKDKGEAYLDLVANPKYGYGRAMNPCIDCRIYMFQIADGVRQEHQADFIVTGEVLGQRPMSQQRNSMGIIDRKSELGDLILRPLSAKHFPPSLPEREGWIDREQLLDIEGRKRVRQFELASQMKLEGYSQPGGGCLLTEKSFESRLRDFYAVPHYSNATQRMAQSRLLRIGRHFRFSPETKIIISRNEAENHQLEAEWKESSGTLLTPNGFSGPSAVGLGKITPEILKTIGEIIVRYGKASEEIKKIEYETPTEKGFLLVQSPYAEEKLNAIRL